MALGIYKKGQGYWTRVMSAIALGMIVLMGGVWLSDNLKNVRLFGFEPIYTRAAAFLIFVTVCSILGYWFIGHNSKSVEFLIATEGEMKKVNWSSKREIRGSTIVVIGLTFIVGTLIWLLDSWIYYPFFEWIGVLETSG